MKEKPINLKDWEVRAILDGRKTQFRRLVKPQPGDGLTYRGLIITSTIKSEEGLHLFADAEVTSWRSMRIRCPYGQPGDRLWVRETFFAIEPRHDGDTGSVLYRADGHGDWTGLGRSPIHMPRWASRIDLDVVSVRVERLNDISEGEAEEEGAPAIGDQRCRQYTAGFIALWQSTYGPGSWDANPFVWVVEFRQA